MTIGERPPRLKGPRGLTAYLWVWGPDRAVDTAFDAAFGWAVAHSVDSPAVAALIFALSFAPQTLLLLVGGALGDRWGLLRTAATTLAARAMVLTGLGVSLLQDDPAIWLLIGVALAISVLDSWHFPAVEGLAGKLGGDSEKAQGEVASASQSVGRLGQMSGGYALGALLGWQPAATPLAAAALLVVAVVALGALARARPDLKNRPMEGDEAEPPLLTQIATDLQRVRGIPTIWTLLTVLALSNALSAPVLFLGLPLRAQEQGWSGAWYAIALASFPLGAIIGGVVMNRAQTRLAAWSSANRMTLAVGSIFPAASGMILLAAAPHPALVALGSLWAGLSFAPSATLIKARIRALTPSSAQGLTNAVTSLGVYVGIPAGHLLFGALAAALSTTSAGLVLTGLLALSAIPGMFRVRLAIARET